MFRKKIGTNATCECVYCGSDENGIIRNEVYGWICPVCLAEFDRIDEDTDWDEFEENKRQLIAENNEY